MFQRKEKNQRGFKVAGLIIMIVALFVTTSGLALADTYVRGYFRSNGTYVQPHYRSNPDGNFYNNWSTYPNVNPYTGKVGTRRTPSYQNLYNNSFTTPGWSTNNRGFGYGRTSRYESLFSD